MAKITTSTLLKMKQSECEKQTKDDEEEKIGKKKKKRKKKPLMNAEFRRKNHCSVP